jgi:hypothetical protein
VAEFAQLIFDRTGLTVDYAWAQARAESLMVHVRQLAPAKRTEWATFEDLPTDVQTVVLDALGRMAENPRGFRSEQIGEYTYQVDTWRLGASGVFTQAEESVVAREGGSAAGGLYSVGMSGNRSIPQATPDIGWDDL